MKKALFMTLALYWGCILATPAHARPQPAKPAATAAKTVNKNKAVKEDSKVKSTAGNDKKAGKTTKPAAKTTAKTDKKTDKSKTAGKTEVKTGKTVDKPKAASKTAAKPAATTGNAKTAGKTAAKPAATTGNAKTVAKTAAKPAAKTDNAKTVAKTAAKPAATTGNMKTVAKTAAKPAVKTDNAKTVAKTAAKPAAKTDNAKTVAKTGKIPDKNKTKATAKTVAKADNAKSATAADSAAKSNKRKTAAKTANAVARKADTRTPAAAKTVAKNTGKAQNTAKLAARADKKPKQDKSAALPVGVSKRRDSVIAQGKRLIGTPYLWGGTSPGGFDCSGLVHYVYKKHGVSLPRTSRDQFASLPATGNPQPGDLVFFRKKGVINHVGIYVGGGKMLHAPQTGSRVRIESIEKPNWQRRYAGARRVLNDQKTVAAKTDGGQKQRVSTRLVVKRAPGNLSNVLPKNKTIRKTR